MRVERHLNICIATVAIWLCSTQLSFGQDAAAKSKHKNHTSHSSTTSSPSSSSTKKATKKIEPALDGYCPAAYLLEGKALRGNPKFSSVYIGETYYLSSKKAKLAFESDPAKYLPKLGGWGLMALGGPYGNRIIANPEVFQVIDGSVYLFSSQRAKNFYASTPGGVVEKANKIFGQARLFSHCPVSYITKNKAIRGNPKLLVAYKRAAYCFANAKARSLFMKQPTLYVPPYEGYGAISLVSKKLSHANPNIFSVYQGKTYFFLDTKGKQRFDKDPTAIIKKADLIWKKVQEKKIVRKGEDPNG